MVNKNNYELFLYFINQRESVRIKKDAGLPAPWTDEILQKYKFTNVRRRDDRHTKYVHSVLEKIYKEYSGEERNIIMRNFIYFAIRTSMDGLQTLVSVYNFDFKEFIQAQQDHKKSFRQGAYIVRLQWENYYEWMTDNLDKVNSHNLNDCKYLGGFMINQICVYYRDVYVLFGITLGNQEEMTYYSYGKNLGTGGTTR